jgi:serine protease Do
MKHTYLIGIQLLALAASPVMAQKATTTVRHFSTTPVTVEFEGAPSHSYLGVGVADLTTERVQALKLKDDRGVEVVQVDQDAPAGKAGFKEHDVIVAFNGTPVESQEQFKRLMRETPPGRTVAMDIMRDGQPQKIKVQLADRKKLESSVWPREPENFAMVMPPTPPMPPMPDFPRAWTEQSITRIRSTSGVTLESLTPQLGDYFGVKNGEGMLVRSVQKGSAAESAGLRAGDVITKVGDQKISDNSDWREALRNGKNGKISVTVVRDKRELTLSMSVPARRGSDSSALIKEDLPETELAIASAADALENVEPLIEDGELMGNSVVIDGSEMNRAMRKAMEQLHRELIDNRSNINRNISSSLKLASAQLKAHGAELRRAMREASRALALQCESGML